MNTALIQPDPEQQRFNKGTSTNTHATTTTTSNYVTSHNKLKSAINNDAIPFITTTNSAPPNNPTSTTTTTTIATTLVAQQQRGHGIYGHSLSGSLSKIASISRDYLYPIGSHGSLSTSYDAFFTDDGYNEAEQGGIMAGPYTNGPVEFEDSRFYEGRYEDGVHDEYDYDASSSSDSHGYGQYNQHQQEQHTQQQLRFSEEPMATEPTILAGSYRRHREQSNNNMQSLVKQPNDQGAVTPLTASALLSPLRYRDVESAFGIRNDGDKEAPQYHLPSQSQLFQPEFTTGMNGAGYLEESVMEDNYNHGDGDDGMMRDESEKKHNGSWRQQSSEEQEMGQDKLLLLQDSGEEDGGDDDEEDGSENDEEGDNDGRGESDDGEDDDEDDEGGPGGGTVKGRKKSGRPVTSQKTIPKAMVTLPPIQKEHRNQKHGHHSQSDSMQHHSLHHHAPQQHQSMPQQSHYQTQQQLHQQQQHYQQQHQHSNSSLSLSSSSSSSTCTSTSSYHSSNFISEQQFLLLADDYLLSLSPKKREKALLSNSMYQKILMVLIQPKNTQVSTAQFRFWAKKMFTLSTTPTHHVVCHGGKPVATKECLYDVLVYCHRKSSHGGRDKTSAEVRQHYSWVPKELIARFVKHCPLCLSRRSTQQRQNSGPVAAGTNGPVGSISDTDGASPSFLKSHNGQRFESQPPLHGSVAAAAHVGGGEEDRGNGGEDNGGFDVDQGGLPDMHARFGGDIHREVQQQLTLVQPHNGTYRQQQQQQQHHHATSSSMQRTGFDTLQSPNSPFGNTHERSQPWAWRESGVGVVDPQDGGSVVRQQLLHDSSVSQDHSQDHGDGDDGGMQVDRDYGHGHEGDENDDIEVEAGSHQTEIHISKNLTNPPSTTAVAAHSGLYYNKSNNQDTAAFCPDEDSNGSNSPSGMVGISQDLGQYDGHQHRDPAFLHYHQQQQQRLFQQNHHPHRHQHQNSTGLRRHHPYQHRHTYDNSTSVNCEVAQAVTTVHPNGHILYDRHPIHNRARIMALANSAATANAATTATGGDPAGALAIPPIQAIRQAALALSQQYRHHHHHHHQQQHHNTHNHRQFASGSHHTYVHHHGHRSQQQQQQQQSYRQVMAHSHPGVISGHSSAFMYTFTNPDVADVDGEDGDDDDGDGAYDHEVSEEGPEDDDETEGDANNDPGQDAQMDY